MAKEKKATDYPYPVKLGEMKERLRKQAYDQDRSLHYWIRKILKSHLDNTSQLNQ